MKFWVLFFLSRVRGFLWKWPSFPRTPQGYSGISCGFRSNTEAKIMFDRHGWVPYCTYRFRDGSYSRLFIQRDDHPSNSDWSGPAKETA